MSRLHTFITLMLFSKFYVTDSFAFRQTDWQSGALKVTKRLLISYLIGFIAFSGVGLGFLFNPFGTKEAEAAWFNDNWLYRQEIPFTSTNGSAQSNVFLSFTLDTRSNNSAGLINQGKLQSACQDIRITDQGGKLLPYHIGRTNACDNASTTIDFLVSSFPDGKSTYYVYYGNPSVVSADVGAFSQSQASNYSVSSLGSEAKGTSPVAYWKFDDAQGTTAQDATTNNLDGTMSNFAATPTANSSWQTEDNCISGKCLAFDKADDVVSAGTPSQLNDMGPVTFSVWVYPLSMGEGSAGIIFSKNVGTTPSAGWLFQLAGTNALKFSVDGTTDLVRQTANNAITLNQWNHVELTWDGVITTASSVHMYVNGAEVSSYATTTNGAARVSDATSIFRVGNDSTGANTWDGKIDEPKVYNYVRSSTQIKADFDARSNPEGTSAQLGNNINTPGALSNGLVGYWKLDETATPSTDYSGNGGSGTWTGTTSTTGKFGNGNSFDGADDKVQVADSNVLDVTNVTLAAWINATALGGVIIDKATGAAGTDGYYMDTSGSKIRFCATNGCVSSTTSLSTGTWTHIAVTYDGTTVRFYLNGAADGTSTGTITSVATNAANLILGLDSASTGDYNGKIDEARVYNRALSAAEISRLYNWAPGPVGYWKMDEAKWTNDCSTVTAYDSSGNGFNGTSCPNSTGPTNTAPGKYGKAGSFDGADDYLSISHNSALIPKTVTMSAWVYLRSCPQFQPVVNKNNGNPFFNYSYDLQTPFCVPTFQVSDGAAATDSTQGQVLNTNTWNFLTGTFDGSTIKIYVNGVLANSQSSSLIPSTGTGPLQIGGCSLGCGFFNGYIDDVKEYNYVRTQAQIVEDMNAGHPAPGSPVGSSVAYWKFDEGYGTKVNDSTPNRNDLTLNTATSAWTSAGKFGKAWLGGGSNWISRADDDDLDFTSSDDGSISLWFKSTSASNPGGNEYLVSKGPGNPAAGYAIYANSSGQICFGIDDDSTWGPDDSSCSSADVYDTNWHHVVAVKTGTTQIQIFVDSIAQTADTSISATSTLANASAFYIGDFNGADDGNEFNGTIDEVKVYRSALNPDQVKIDMNKSQSERLGNAGNHTGSGYESTGSQNQIYCVPGDATSCNAPVGEWNFDENNGSSANDTSGGGSTGSITGATWASGKYSPALKFNGGTDTVTVSSSLSTKTVEFWVNPSTTTQKLIDLRTAATAANISVSSGTISATGFTSPTIYVNGRATSTLVANQWQHVAITTATTITANAIQFGRISSTSLTGYLDQIWIFDYARTGAQVAWDYNQGKPIGWWKMDECQGTTLHDSSGNSINGTLSLAPAGTTAAGTCTTSGAWFNGVTGKRNYSIALDGTDDYIDASDSLLPSGANPRTLAAWIKTNVNANQTIMVYGTAGPNNQQYYLAINNLGTGVNNCSNISTGGNRALIMGAGGSGFNICDNLSLIDGNWHFVVGTYDGTTAKLYVDGALRQSFNPSATNTILAGTLRFGNALNATILFSGQMDDARIYNYALTATQVKTLYDEGAVRFGPTTGAP